MNSMGLFERLARGAVAQLDDLGQRLGAASRLQRLTQIFGDATRLEIGFWQMGLDAHPSPHPSPGDRS